MEQNNTTSQKTELLRIIYERSFKYDPNKGFNLASGAKSDVYIDLKQTTTTSRGGYIIGRIVYEMIKNLPVKAIGGLTLGADPIAYAVMMTSALEEHTVNAFIIRKTVKQHGTGKVLEGCVSKGDNVVIIDDVVTTGGSTIEAILKAQEFGLNISKVIAIVDREEGGAANIEKHINDFSSVFTKSDLLDLRK